jgi:hypothetical protein
MILEALAVTALAALGVWVLGGLLLRLAGLLAIGEVLIWALVLIAAEG